MVQTKSKGMTRQLSVIMLALSALGLSMATLLAYHAPAEATMGAIQKIFYFHVPCAWITMLSAVLCGIFSIIFLWTKNPTADHISVATAELVVLFGLCVLITGPIWAKPIWNTYWQWDVRLTTTLLLWIIFVVYLFARNYAGPGGKTLAAGLAIFGMVDVPLIYISVSWFRTIHPKTTVVFTLAPPMRLPFFTAMISFTLLLMGLLLFRAHLEQIRMRTQSLVSKIREQYPLDETLWDDDDETD